VLSQITQRTNKIKIECLSRRAAEAGVHFGNAKVSPESGAEECDPGAEVAIASEIPRVIKCEDTSSKGPEQGKGNGIVHLELAKGSKDRDESHNNGDSSTSNSPPKIAIFLATAEIYNSYFCVKTKKALFVGGEKFLDARR
jgi:hypothetical protein